MSSYKEYSKTLLAEILESIRLDVRYERAEGNTLFYRDENGEEQAVLDLLGGYGALIAGHNYPEIVETARELLASNIPFHAQFSVKEKAGELAEALNKIVQRELGAPGKFHCIFANSGAESVEAAVKHAEMERVKKQEKIVEKIRFQCSELERKHSSGSLTFNGEKLTASLPGVVNIPEIKSMEELFVFIENRNAELLEAKARMLALKRSFHGKLIGSVQLTHGKAYRKPFRKLGIETHFVDPDDLESVRLFLEGERRFLYSAEAVDGQVRLVPVEMPVFTAFIVEPIQGEGGVHCLTVEAGAAIRKLCNTYGFPLIIDEVQTGLGRCGRFLASADIGLRGDYYALSKSLAGGVCKIGVAMIAEDRFDQEFGLIHSSTFAEDDYSCAVALKVLDILERDNGAAYGKIREAGSVLMNSLLYVKDKFPDVIVDVRGRGLLVGVEFKDQGKAQSAILKSVAYSESLGYILSGCLLRRYAIRVAPPASAPNVLRMEPSMDLTEEDVERLVVALIEICKAIRFQDAYHLIHHVAAGASGERAREEIRDFRAYYRQLKKAGAAKIEAGAENVPKAAFINHLIGPEWLADVDPSLADLTRDECANFVRRMSNSKKTAPFDPVRINSPAGNSIDFILYPLCVSSEQMTDWLVSGDLEEIREAVDERVEAARKDGCTVAGLGMFNSIVTDNCQSVEAPNIALTSGNALTVAMGIEAIETAVAQKERSLEDLTLAVVGAAGNIASIYAAILAERVGRLLLVGSNRQGSLRRLSRTEELIYEECLKTLGNDEDTVLSGKILSSVASLPLVAEWLEDKTAPKPSGKEIARCFHEGYPAAAPIEKREDLGAVGEADIVLCAASVSKAFLTGAGFKKNAIICDIAVPNNVVDDVEEERPDLTYMRGGIVSTPNGESLDPRTRAYLGQGQLYACMTETAILGLEGITDHFSYGTLKKEQVFFMAQAAKKHGFGLSDYKRTRSL